ncbi:Hypothetical protein R9X50_00406200 [Acrodontium crateriforme]|uniref:Uncharacterized protein n=1 Tax=Acrodontium crateriforme TaxID=150365 RepID=A0AAQ3M7B5_9PEZI|nr:Hypothetical protein R9X50_00406200 [Acrodontium crateriforme]
MQTQFASPPRMSTSHSRMCSLFGAEDDDGDDSHTDILDLTDDEAIAGLDDGQKALMKAGADDVLSTLTGVSWRQNFPLQVVGLTADAKPLLLKAWTKDDTKVKYQAKLDNINKYIRDVSPLENVKVMENGKKVEKMLPVGKIHEIDGRTILSRIKTIRDAAASYEEGRQAGQQVKMTQACQNIAIDIWGLISLLYRNGLNLIDMMNKTSCLSLTAPHESVVLSVPRG